MAEKLHIVTFQRNMRDNTYRAMCTCGWFHHAETLEECQMRSAGHDLEWQTVENSEEADAATTGQA